MKNKVISKLIFKVLDKDEKEISLEIKKGQKVNKFASKYQVIKALENAKPGTYKIVSEDYIEVKKA